MIAHIQSLLLHALYIEITSWSTSVLVYSKHFDIIGNIIPRSTVKFAVKTELYRQSYDQYMCLIKPRTQVVD